MTIDRRKFLRTTAIVAAISGFTTSRGESTYKKAPVTNNSRALKKMPIGVIASADNPEEDLRIVKDMGFSVCQLNISEYSPEFSGAHRIYHYDVLDNRGRDK